MHIDNCFLNVLIVNVNMFGSAVHNRILENQDSPLAIFHQQC